MKNLFALNKLFMLICFFLLAGTSYAQNEISPYMYGVNAWMANQIGGGADGGDFVQLGGIVDQLWDRVGEGNPRIIRIGGIAYDDNRPSTAQYVSWINAIRAIGAEPLVQVSRGKDNNSTPAQAAALVNELNNVRGLDVKLWSIANEPDFHYYNFNLSDKNMQTITDYTKSYSDAMKSQDPDILIAGAAFSNWKNETPKLLQSGSFDISGISPKTGKPYIDIFDWHYYPIFNDCYTFEQAIATPEAIGNISGCNGSWYGLRGKLQELEGLINAANARHGRTGSTGLKWGISEFNITVRNPGGPKSGQGTASFLAGQYWADVMGISAEFGGEYVIGWSIHESGGANTAFDLGVLGNGNGTEKRSTFYHMKMLSDDMKGQFLSSADNLGDVKTFAVREGNVYKILVMNQGRGNQGYNYDISFNNSASGQLAINVNAGANINHSGFIDSRETKLFVFTNGNNTPEKVITYNLGMYENNQAPSVVTQNPPVTPVTQSPFVTQNIPGKIQAEDFDIGGQGVAYNDVNTANNGGAYRDYEGVDIEATANDGGGFNVGWIGTGEWTEYTIANVDAGTYTITVDVASNSAVKSAIAVSLDGVALGILNPSNTNGWQNWETLTLNNVSLSGGTNQILRLDYTGVFNVDFINFEQSGGTGGGGGSSNMITNGTFNNGLNGWGNFVRNGNATASFNVNNTGQAVAAITHGGSVNWNVQLSQTGLNIEHGKTYRLAFDARATAARSIWVGVEQNGNPYTGYGGPGTLHLVSTFQAFTYTFTMSEATDPDARLTFNLGVNSTDVFIDNVILQEVVGVANIAPVANAGSDQAFIDTNLNGTSSVCLNGAASSDSDGAINSYIWSENGQQFATGESPCVDFALGTHVVTLTVTDNNGASVTDDVIITIASGNMITNGTFGSGLNGWDTFVFTDVASGTIGVNVAGQAVATISNGGNTFWHVQLIQTDLNIVNGKTYELSFDARATANRTIIASVEQDGNPYTSYGGSGVINLASNTQTFTSTFTMTKPTDANARLVFNSGASNSNVFIDNVSLKEVISAANKRVDLESVALSVYPNPTKSELFISGLQEEDYMVTVYCIAGRKELNAPLSATKNGIDVSNLSLGLHLVVVTNTSGEMVSTMKFMKQ